MTNKKKYVVWFEEVGKNDGGLVGGKGANLGEMVNAGFPIPPGFIVTSSAYFKFLKESGLKNKIKKLLLNLDHSNSKELEKTTAKIRNLIKRAPVPKEVTNEVFKYYHLLPRHKSRSKSILNKIKSYLSEPLVAIRSSATAEDLPDASFAGQQETYLNVQGDANVIQKIRAAWASLFTARAVFYRVEKKFDHLKVAIAIPVQKMINADTSGVMFTIDPVTNSKKNIVIEAIYGLGELIVQGAVTPDHYLIDKKSLKIHQKHIGEQEKKMILKNKKNIIQNLKKSDAQTQKVSNAHIKKLAEYGKRLEKHYYFPQDIEWAIENNIIYILQTRPVTTIYNQSRLSSSTKESSSILSKELKLLLTGNPASPGIASGKVVIIKSTKEIYKVKGGDILVAQMTNPDFVPAMRRAVAIVTEKGGRTSHAAIVSRELGIPAVVGANNAIKKLVRNQIITVDGSTGKIYKGGLSRALNKKKITPEAAYSQKSVQRTKIKTATHVYCNLATTARAEEISKLNVDGIGLLRAEFMIADIGYHPRYLIKQKKQNLFINKMSQNLARFCKFFGKDRPVVYRSTDFKANEYKSLKGGSLYEDDEENPMLGFRGAYRYISDPKVFNLELQVIKKVRNKLGYRNLWLMIPFVRTVDELKKIRKLVQEAGLYRSVSFKLWMMVEIPSNVILIDDFIKIGIDGISVGSNDLTQLTLGIDRDSEKVAKEFSEFNPAVLWSIKKVIEAAKKSNITSSICGQAPSDYPDLVEKLVKWGITSVSVNPDAIERTREFIYGVENKLVKSK